MFRVPALAARGPFISRSLLVDYHSGLSAEVGPTVLPQRCPAATATSTALPQPPFAATAVEKAAQPLSQVEGWEAGAWFIESTRPAVVGREPSSSAVLPELQPFNLAVVGAAVADSSSPARSASGDDAASGPPRSLSGNAHDKRPLRRSSSDPQLSRRGAGASTERFTLSDNTTVGQDSRNDTAFVDNTTQLFKLVQDAQERRMTGSLHFNAGLKAHEDGAPNEALEHYTKSAGVGNTRAMVNAATLLLQEHSQPAAVAALELLEDACARHDARAQVFLGSNLCFGGGLDVELGRKYDPERGCEMLRGAAHRGSREGMLQLARCFDAGVGVGADRAEALRWCRRAAKRGLTEAQFVLGVWCAEDDKLDRAAHWYRKAAAQGSESAAQNLQLLNAQ